jgi:hypothetical protein
MRSKYRARGMARARLRCFCSLVSLSDWLIQAI